MIKQLTPKQLALIAYEQGDKCTLNNWLKPLKIIHKYISSEEWDIIVRFCKGVSGWNRSIILKKLSEALEGKTIVTKTILHSYSNKSLEFLIDRSLKKVKNYPKYYIGSKFAKKNILIIQK